MSQKAVVIVIVIVTKLYDCFIVWLSQLSRYNPVPPCVADIYDSRAYRLHLFYQTEKKRLALYQSAQSFTVDLILLLFNVHALFAGLFGSNTWVQMFAVVLLNSFTELIRIPTQYYDTMVIEQRYGFNRTTVRTFTADRIKEYILELATGLAIGSLLLWLHRTFGDWLILLFTGIAMLVILFIFMLYPFLSRLFHSFKPLEDGELKDRLTALLQRNGYRIRAIRVMDASRRSTKANAYFAGFGKAKTIVLYDTLLELLTPDEITAVFAHELGHGLHKDMLKTHLMSLLTTLLIGFFAWITLRSPDLFRAFGFEEINYGFAVYIMLSVEFELVSSFLALIITQINRSAEYRADAFAVRQGYGNELISALKKLARRNFSDLAPSRLLVALTYSHPPLAQRIEAILVQQSHVP